MTQVTVTSNYRVVIPKEVRERLKIRKGQKVDVVARDGYIEVTFHRERPESE